MVPDLNDAKVQRLLKKINSKYEPIYIPVVAESYALPNECYPNVEKKVELDGGSRIFGWQIWRTTLICEAEFHAVWKSHDGKLLDITPKSPPVESILFIQDDSVTYNGAQIDNIRINNTNNPLVNDLIDIHKALFRIRNKGHRAFIYKGTLNGEEAKVYRNLESIGSILQSYIYQGGQIDSFCFCGSGFRYAECHRRELDSLILRSKSV
ncbi:hypothetical protein DMN77_09400 [Paenibacillus sp. 79R4]|uniref:hypothetical protein n=1 Tax=Paenibacillus sp. 79R4 TaxID=2212847 RepID=UPI0015BA3D3F|nr:hypothetical protein [Paenibacillus sp. 79R4]NWL87816.1 hypothetical protein [Paenibacillus sp. 79R4]